MLGFCKFCQALFGASQKRELKTESQSNTEKRIDHARLHHQQMQYGYNSDISVDEVFAQCFLYGKIAEAEDTLMKDSFSEPSAQTDSDDVRR